MGVIGVRPSDWAADRIRLVRRIHRSGPCALLARMHFDPAAHGLPPRERLDPRRAGPPPPVYRVKERLAIADEAWEGDWRSAAAYVDAAGQDWDERWSRIELLQEIARRDDAWVARWRQARPYCCDAATLNALRLVHRAWEIRGSGYAHEVTTARMARFRELLPAAIETARAAAVLNPKDPGPWVAMIIAARGARYSHARFGELWEELAARAPHHYGGHWQALQYWCAKWAGSDELMMDFAARAVAYAPAGSPLAGLHVVALHEFETQHGGPAPVTAERRALLARVSRSLGTVPTGDERLPRLRHLLAYHLGEAGLHAAALEQFRLLGPWCGAEPWTDGGDAVSAFERARAVAAYKARRSRTALEGPDSPPVGG